MSDQSFEFCITIMGFIALIMLSLCLGNYLGAKSCSHFGSNSNLETKYDFYSGCYVKIDSNWINTDNYKVIKGSL